MKKIDHGVVAVTVLCVFLGAMIGIQLKTVQSQATVYDIQRVSELSAELKNAVSEKENMTKTLAENEKKMAEYEKYLTEESETLKLLIQETNQLKTLSGLTDLSGRGILITVDDSKKAGQASGGVSTDAFLVHAEDILSIINEINVAGAEAISINGQRIVAQSAVRCAGSVVNVNDIKIAAPFVITAIGNPDILEAALSLPGGIADSLKPWGIELVIKKMEKVDVPAYGKRFEYKEAIQPKAEE